MIDLATPHSLSPKSPLVVLKVAPKGRVSPYGHLSRSLRANPPTAPICMSRKVRNFVSCGLYLDAVVLFAPLELQFRDLPSASAAAQSRISCTRASPQLSHVNKST